MLVAVVTPDLHPTRESIKRRYLSQERSKQVGNQGLVCCREQTVFGNVSIHMTLEFTFFTIMPIVHKDDVAK